MAQSPNGQSGNQSSVAPSSDLGANEWLVEEMKEQYDKDPGSVGPEWASYFGNGSAAPAAQQAQTPRDPGDQHGRQQQHGQRVAVPRRRQVAAGERVDGAQAAAAGTVEARHGQERAGRVVPGLLG